MDAQSQHLWVRKSAGLYQRSHLAALDVLGDDRFKLLHGLLSNDVEGLKPGGGNLSHLLTPKGKIQAEIEVYALPDRLRLLSPKSVADAVQKNIAMRIFRAQVKLEDRRNELAVVGLHGPKALDILQKLAPPVAELKAEYAHVSLPLLGQEVMVSRQHYTGELGFDLVVPSAAVASLVKALLADPAVREIGEDAYKSLTLEAGVPLFGIDFDAENLSLEANLNKAVSVTKGCYLGQETVARIVSRGHVAKRLVGLEMEGDFLPPAGTEVHAEDVRAITETTRALGTITRSAYGPSIARNLALAYLKFDFLEENPGAKVVLFNAEKKMMGKAVWRELPFYKGPVNWLAGGPKMERIVAPQARTRPQG